MFFLSHFYIFLILKYSFSRLFEPECSRSFLKTWTQNFRSHLCTLYCITLIDHQAISPYLFIALLLYQITFQLVIIFYDIFLRLFLIWVCNCEHIKRLILIKWNIRLTFLIIFRLKIFFIFHIYFKLAK